MRCTEECSSVERAALQGFARGVVARWGLLSELLSRTVVRSARDLLPHFCGLVSVASDIDSKSESETLHAKFPLGAVSRVTATTSAPAARSAHPGLSGHFQAAPAFRAGLQRSPRLSATPLRNDGCTTRCEAINNEGGKGAPFTFHGSEGGVE